MPDWGKATIKSKKNDATDQAVNGGIQTRLLESDNDAARSSAGISARAVNRPATVQIRASRTGNGRIDAMLQLNAIKQAPTNRSDVEWTQTVAPIDITKTDSHGHDLLPADCQ